MPYAGLHSAQTANHRLEAFVFTSAAARAAGTGYTLTSADVGKVAYQQDTGTYWRLTLESPITWAPMGNAAAGAAPVALTDAATIATNASLGNYFRVTLGGNRTLGAPTNPTDGQIATWEFIQDGTGGRTLALATGAGGFLFGTDLTAVTLSTAAGKHDLMRAVYVSALNRWLVTGLMRGFS